MNLLRSFEVECHDFPDIAHYLLNQVKLVVANEHEYRIVELEFYLHSDDHPDRYTHQHHEQMRWNRWYFHRVTTKPQSGYKGGTFKGLDLTLGYNGSYCGVLIRAIQPLVTGSPLVNGPCNTVNRILADCEVNSICELTDKFETFNVFECSQLKIEPLQLEHRTVYHGPRIGLSQKYPEFKDLRYRFASTNKKLKQCTSLAAYCRDTSLVTQ